MLTFLIILAIVIVGVVVWRRRVPLMAKLLGQSESRIRQINRNTLVDVFLGLPLLEGLVARSARASTRCASASRGRFSRK